MLSTIRGRGRGRPGYFCVGSLVEVTSDEHGFEDSWYEATIFAVNKTPNRYIVVYDSLLDESGGGNCSLRASVMRRHLRPRPPASGVGCLRVGEVVEARHNEGWWVGIVERVVAEERWAVWFPYPDEIIEFGMGQLRRHLVWESCRWVASNPIKYKIFLDRRNYFCNFKEKKDKAKGCQRSTKGVEPDALLHTSAEKFDIADEIQPTSKAVPFGGTSNLSQFESGDLSIELQFRKEHTLSRKKDAKVSSIGRGLSKRNQKTRLLTSLGEGENEKETQGLLHGSLTEGSILAEDGIQSLTKRPPTRKRLLESSFLDACDENMIRDISGSRQKYFLDGCNLSEVTGMATPLPVKKPKIKSNLISSIHGFKIRDVVESSPLKCMERDVHVDLMSTTAFVGGSRRQQYLDTVGSRWKRKRSTPRRIDCSLEDAVQDAQSRGQQLRMSNVDLLSAMCTRKGSSMTMEFQQRNRNGSSQQRSLSAAFNLSKLKENCSKKDCLPAASARRKLVTPYRTKNMTCDATKYRSQPRNSHELPSKCFVKDSRSDRKGTCSLSCRRSKRQDQIVRNFNNILHPEQQSSLKKGFIGDWSNGYSVRVSKKEQRKEIDQDITSAAQNRCCTEAMNVNMLPQNVKSKSSKWSCCNTMDCTIMDSGQGSVQNVGKLVTNIETFMCSTSKTTPDSGKASFQNAVGELDVCVGTVIFHTCETASGSGKASLHNSIREYDADSKLVVSNKIDQARIKNGQTIHGSVEEVSHSELKPVLDRAGDVSTKKDQNKCHAFKDIGKNSNILSCESQPGNMGSKLGSTISELEVSTLPFLKTSPLWDSLHLLGAFHFRDQQPHFSPLKSCRVEYREGTAIGLMVSFASLVESVCKLTIIDAPSTFEEKLMCLAEFEEYGFAVDNVQKCLEELVRIKDENHLLQGKEAELENQIADKEGEVRRVNLKLNSIDKELAELENAVATLRDGRSSTMLFRASNESELARLKEELLSVKQAYLSCERNFRDTVRSLSIHNIPGTHTT